MFCGVRETKGPGFAATDMEEPSGHYSGPTELVWSQHANQQLNSRGRDVPQSHQWCMDARGISLNSEWVVFCRPLKQLWHWPKAHAYSEEYTDTCRICQSWCACRLGCRRAVGGACAGQQFQRLSEACVTAAWWWAAKRGDRGRRWALRLSRVLPQEDTAWFN